MENLKISFKPISKHFKKKTIKLYLIKVTIFFLNKKNNLKRKLKINKCH